MCRRAFLQLGAHRHVREWAVRELPERGAVCCPQEENTWQPCPLLHLFSPCDWAQVSYYMWQVKKKKKSHKKKTRLHTSIRNEKKYHEYIQYISKSQANVCFFLFCFVLLFQVTFHWHWIYEEAGENREHCTCHCQSWRAHHRGETGVQREGEIFHIHHSGYQSGSLCQLHIPVRLLCTNTKPFLIGSHSLTLWQIRQDLAANGICVYPQKEYDEDPQERIINDRVRVTTTLPSLPIAFDMITD